MRIAGLDVSTKRIGYASPDGTLHSLTARAGSSDVSRRLYELVRELDRFLRLYPPMPDLVAVEGYSLASPGRLSLVRLGEIGGAIRLRLFEMDVPYVEIPPTSLKLHATGAGNADKWRMIDAAIRLGAHGGVNDDEADAFHLRRMARQAHGLERASEPHELDAIANLAW